MDFAGGEAADARTYLDQISGTAFLEAFETLKGGGTITEMEGQKATAAMARLATTQSPEAARESLKELRGILKSAASRESSAPVPSQSSAPMSPADMSDEEIKKALGL